MSQVIKKDLIIKVSNKTGIRVKDTALVVDSFLAEMAAQLSGGGIVALREFGVFEVRASPQRIGRNPKQPDIPITIPARRIVRFRPSRMLADGVAALPAKD